jgi:DNA polymerase I
MKTLLLVDASSYLYRAFHALPDLRTKAGEPTGAIYGVLNMLRRLHKDVRADYSACVFDAKGRTFRDDWYPEYKATRTPMPDDLSVQVAPLYECIRALGWPLLEVPGVEADDVIGTLASEATRLGIRTVISSSDKDLTQLVDPQVTMVNTMSNETFDEAHVLAKFGVKPGQVADYLSLIGDSIDNIPGVEKVGPKTAVKWLSQYGSLENLIAHADEVTGAVGENLRKARDWLPQAQRLVTIKRDLDLPSKVEELTHRPGDTAALAKLFDRFEFRTWRHELGETSTADVARAARPSETREYTSILSADELTAWLGQIDVAALTAVNVETTGSDPMTAALAGISLSVEPGKAAYLPLGHRYTGAPEQLAFEPTLARVKQWLEDPTRPKVTHNAKQLLHVLANYGIRMQGLADDTLLESYVVESHRSHDLGSLAERHLGTKLASYEDIGGKGSSQIGFDQVMTEQATQYSAERADMTLQLHGVLTAEIEQDQKLPFIYRQIEMPVTRVLFDMERHGVLIDAGLLEAQSHELGTRMLELEKQAHEQAGQSFNLGSPKQIQELLFEKQKLPVIKKTPSGQPSTDEDVLQELALNYPLPKLILEYRGVSKLKSTYTDKLPRMVNPRTGRVHTNYAQAVAITGRLSSNEPNLQNIPIRTAEGRRIREAFIAPPGYRVVSADYSQIELRIMAHLSRDATLLAAFASGEDVHRRTASEVFAVPPDQLTSEQRRYAKVINFGLMYGMSAFGLAAALGVERSAAQQYMDRYFLRYPGVAEYMRRRTTTGLRRDGLRPAAVYSRHQRIERPAPPSRGASRDQCTDARNGS